MRKDREAVAVIGEGITEKYYLLSLRDFLKIKPTPIKPKNSSLKELENSIKECIKKGFSRIFCLIDRDNKIYDGDPGHEANAKEYAELKRKYHKKQHRCSDGSTSVVIMIESFPATEIFFLYYFGFTDAFFTNHQLKFLLNQRYGYLTEEKFLIKHSLHEVFTSYGGSLVVAINASEQSIRNKEENRNIHSSYSEIGVLLKFLGPL